MKMKSFTIMSVVMISLFHLTGISQNNSRQHPPPNREVDTRIDNMGYWTRMAELGLVPVNPVIPFRPAEYKGSEIESPALAPQDSPDVPVTSLNNTTQSENSIFVDPNDNTYALNSNNSTTWNGSSVGSLYGADYWTTANSGSSWSGSVQGAGGGNSGDPTTAISNSGRHYIGYISDSYGQGVSYSDNGVNWTSVDVAPAPPGWNSMLDKNHMWIDNSPTSPYDGYLYDAWTPFGGGNDTEIEIARSTNNGVSWSSAQNVSSAVNAGSHNQGVNIQTGPNGEVYVVWTIYDSWPSDETAMGMAISTNGGSSYGSAFRIINNIRGIRNTGVSKNMRVNSFPSMAVDNGSGPYSGNIYVVWSNVGVPGTNSGTNISVYMIRSTNGGNSWSTPVRVNQGNFQNGKEAFFPWICCDPSTGTLAVVFYDDRNTGSSSCETWVALSYDAGNTWEDFRVSDVSFTPSAIPGLASDYFGDYLGISGRDGIFYPCWTDNRTGAALTYVSPFSVDLSANFSGNPTSVCAGGSVSFTDQSTGNPTSWNWSFPGGTPSSYNGQNPPAVVYNSTGTYDVSLTVSDGANNDTETKTGYITVQNIVADFTGTPTSIVAGNTVTFTDNSLCNPTSWNWSFPGGNPSSYSGQNPPAIQYDNTGTFDVSLTVSDGANNDTETKTNYITVINCNYCTPTYSTGTSWGDYISLVQLGDINNSTGASSSPYYVYYNTLSTDLQPGSSYALTVSAGTYSSGNNITAWIDFNRNCTFEESERLGHVELGATPQTGDMNFMVPTDAVPGITRLRVREVWNQSNIDPCNEYSYGETEDYNVNILSDDLELSLVVLLDGPYDPASNLMLTDLNPAYIPLSQPYGVTPWNYAGTESVASVPNSNVVDWVLIELRDASDAASATSATRIDRQAGFLLADGSVVATDGSSNMTFTTTVNNNLFVVVWHRNHLAVISANPVPKSSGVYSYDFTTSASQVLGGSLAYLELETGIWGMVGGDGDANGEINNGDKNDVWSAEAGNSGYLMGDFNMDVQVNNGDKNEIWLPNSGKGSQVPDAFIEPPFKSYVPE